MESEFAVFILIGFAAQLVDGALGMAFGLISTSALLTTGLSPAFASAVVHTAEVFTTAASAASHAAQRNIDRRLLLHLAIAGACGAAVGAYMLSNIDGRILRPFIGIYLLVLGVLILRKVFRPPPATDASPRYAAPLGVAGGFLDAIGGGGWGPIVTSTLIGSGHAPHTIIGSVNTAEFFVTTAAAATFFVELGLAPLPALGGLVIGGVIAAPFGALLARRIPAPALMAAVGLLVCALAAWQIAKGFGWA